MLSGVTLKKCLQPSSDTGEFHMDKPMILPRTLLILILSWMLMSNGCSSAPAQVTPTQVIAPSPSPLVTLLPTTTFTPTLIPIFTLVPTSTFTRTPATLTPIPSPEMATNSPTPVVLPSLAGRIVYGSCFPPKLSIVNLDGSGGRVLIDKNPYAPDDPDLRYLTYDNPSWSPDGRWIVFSSTFAKTGEQIFVIKADGSQVKQLTSDWGKHIESPAAWSPDGKKIAFEIDAKIYVMNVDGSGVVPLTKTSLVEYAPAWSPDGQKIAFFSQPIATTTADKLFIVNADGTDRKLVTDVDPGNWDTGVYRIAWSPDGKQIAFIGGSGNTLYTVESDGTNLDPITDSGWEVHEPSYSPDGKWIIVYARAREGSANWSKLGDATHLYLINLQTKNMTQFVMPEAGCVPWQPAWSPVPSLESGGAYTITAWGTDLNLRADSTLKGNSLKKLTEGDTVTVLAGPQQADEYYWWKLRAADGTEGWAVDVSGWYRRVDGNP